MSQSATEQSTTSNATTGGTVTGSTTSLSTPPAPPAPPAPQTRAFSTEDIEKARQEEKDKVYPRLEQEQQKREALEAQVQELLAAQQKREAEEAEARAKAEADAKAKAEAEMSAKDLLAERERELQEQLQKTQSTWEERFQAMQAEREQERAILQKERELADLRAYVQQRLTEEQDQIAPQLRDFITGNTREEIDQSIEVVKAKSVEIATAAREAFQTARSQQRGVSPTGYAPIGPMENEGGTRTYSPEDIANMDMGEYQKLREQIPGLQGNSGRGLFS